MNRVNKIVRIATLSPLTACGMLLSFYFMLPEFFSGTTELLVCIFCLSVVPLLAYPLQRFFPKYRDGGRPAQRNLAIVFTLSGYLLGIVGSIFLHSAANVLVIFLTYLFSGALIALFSKFTEIKASGHAAGVMGPLVGACYFLGGLSVPTAVFVALYAASFYASIKMQRHTAGEFLTGSLASIASMFISVMLCGLA